MIIKSPIKTHFNLALLLLLLIPFGAFARTSTSWTGILSTDANDPGNWSGGIPDATVDAFFGDQYFTGKFQPELTANLSCHNLVIGEPGAAPQKFLLSLSAKSQSLTIMGDLVVHEAILQVHGGTITLQGDIEGGKIYLEDNQLVLEGMRPQYLNADLLEADQLLIDNPSGGVFLQQTIIVRRMLSFLAGDIHTSSGALLTLLDGALIKGASAAGFVNGPLQKTGKEAFEFPIGRIGAWGNRDFAPISISAPGKAEASFTATYHRDRQLFGDTIDPSLAQISNCEYWTLENIDNSVAVEVSISWDENSCGIGELGKLAIARWSDHLWEDLGNSGTSGDRACGWIKATKAMSSGPVILASGALVPQPETALYLVNKGAQVNIGPQVTLVVNGNLANRKNAKLHNRSQITLLGDFINFGGRSGYISEQGKVILSGLQHQTIVSNESTDFQQLTLSGDGLKQMLGDIQVEGSLDLQDLELSTSHSTLTFINTDHTALQRSKGFISSRSGGSLIRHMNSTDTYLFPVGANGPIYRPVAITPENETFQAYSVRFIDHDPTQDGYDINRKSAGIDAINKAYYHKIGRVEGYDPVDIDLFFDTEKEEAFNTVAHWQGIPQWEAIENLEQIAATPETMAHFKLLNWTDFEYFPFAFAYKQLDVQALVIHESPNALGAIHLQVSGGKPPYQYEWNGQQTPTTGELKALFTDTLGFDSLALDIPVLTQNNNLQDLASGTYSVNVIDALGKEQSLDIPVGVEWAWVDQNGLSIDEHSIIKTSSDGWGNGTATAANVFASGVDGAFQFALDQLDADQAIGLRTENNAPSMDYRNMDFAFFIQGQDIHIWENGQLHKNVSIYHAEDLLHLERQGSMLQYRQNDKILRTANIPIAGTYFLDVSIFTEKAKIYKGLIIGLSHWPTLRPTIKHVSCGEAFDGSITLNASHYGKIAFTYEWYYQHSLIATTQDLTGLGPGVYTVKIDYLGKPPANQAPLIRTFTIGYEVKWDELDNVTANANDLTRATWGNGWDAGAISLNILAGYTNGWAEFQLNDLQDRVAFGLSHSNSGPGPTIDYGLIIDGPSRSVFVLETGNTPHVTFFNPRSSDIRIRIERKADLIRYSVNGSDIGYTSAISQPDKPLIVDASIFNQATIKEAITSFSCPTEIDYTPHQYAALTKKMDALYYGEQEFGDVYDIFLGVLRFKYEEDYATDNDILDFKIFKATGDPGQVLAPLTPANTGLNLPVQTGDNWYEIPICSYLPQGSGWFILEVNDQKGEKEYLKFYAFCRK